MKFQPNRDYKSDDVVQTPLELCERLVRHFSPAGRILEPCCGEGNFLRFLPEGTKWCEISKGVDFLKFQLEDGNKLDWIITNPPWSKIRQFLRKSMEVSNNVVFLMTINHLWTKARLRDIKEAGFFVYKIVLIDTPKSFPASGFQLGAVHITRNEPHYNLTEIVDWRRAIT